MDRSRPCPKLDIIITPSADITRLWNTFRPVDCAFLQLIIGDLPLLADSPVDWTLLRTAISFWDTQRAVFSFHGTELAPTVEDYAALLQQSMPIHDIVVLYAPEFNLVGARMRTPKQTRLGSIHLPVGMRDGRG
ncbi:hypothetical protein CDL15_Pgr024887 [Punica granatum]|uniref:Uncharacterized protein n=1 Tax=Punica granatum TaxID=22663 RepID=A0A218XCR6_PUNGR|nr:hypothetical protein CDL15_Pgr024887 [Punica granatum]